MAEYRLEFQKDHAQCNYPRNRENSEPPDLEHVPDRHQQLPDFQRIAPSRQDVVSWYQVDRPAKDIRR